jgi:tol-pal system protein YbgF
MNKIISITGAAFALLWLGEPPVLAQNREHQQMAAELRMLQEQQQQLSLALAQLVQQMAESLKAVNARIDETNKATLKASADQELSLKGMGSDLSVIRERTQDTNNRIQALSDEVQALNMTLASLPSLLSQAAPVAPVDPLNPAPATGGPAPVVAAAPSTAGLSPQRMYDTAFADYTAGQYTLAITGFEQLLRTFPMTERADDAQFYIGEAQSQLLRWADAIAAYNRVIQNYPMGDQVAMAYYKRGIAQERFGQIDAARTSFEQAIKRYPESDGGRLAKQGLDRLRPQPATRQ